MWIDFRVNMRFDMFEGYNASSQGEKARSFRLYAVRFGIFSVILVIGLIGLGISKWSKASLHDKLARRHEQTTANFVSTYKNGRGTNVVYSIGYTFTVNGKSYHNYGESTILPTYPRGFVFYDPDDPEENELQPIPKEQEYHGTDR